MFVVKSDRTHYPCWLCQGQAIFSKFRENKRFFVSARNKAKNKKKLLLCFFASCFDSMWAECARTGECNDTARKEFFRCFAATIVSNNFDIKNIYIFCFAASIWGRHCCQTKLLSHCPCGGLSAVSQFLAESSMHYKVKYRPDLETCNWRRCMAMLLNSTLGQLQAADTSNPCDQPLEIQGTIWIRSTVCLIRPSFFRMSRAPSAFPSSALIIIGAHEHLRKYLQGPCRNLYIRGPVVAWIGIWWTT